MKSLIRFALIAACLICPSVMAATYNLSNGQYPNCIDVKNGNKRLDWSVNGSTYSCGYGRVELASGDVLTSNGNITIKAENGFIMASNTIGASGKTIALVATYGPITAAGTNAIYGNLQATSGAVDLQNTTLTGAIKTDSGAITLRDTRVSSTVSGAGTGTFTNGSVAGAVSVSNGLTASGTVFSSTVTASGGSISLTGGSVAGAISGANGVSTNGTKVNGAIGASNGALNVTGGSVTGNLNGGCCKVTLNNTIVSGSINVSSNELAITGSSVTGNITVANSVTLDATTVNGNVTAASWSTITGKNSSAVYGSCSPAATSPTTLCQSPPVQTCFSDDFNLTNGRTDLGPNWAVTGRAGSFGEPRIVDGRLRMTDNTAYNSTGANLLKLAQGAGNKVTVTFRHYAYGGNGADGIVLVFSDGAVTPQPGGFGGSLGYAQINNTSGFAGGWLGVALDEYGNFANPTENRKGGPGLVPDAVTLRGSGAGTTGYNYLATSQSLSPGIDKSGATVAPGYLYRVTLDTTTTGKALVTVERDTGSGYTTLVSSFDALAVSGQAAVPENFYLTLTGSTGGSNNYHEIDDFQVCANKFSNASYAIDHFKFEYSDNALTCSPLAVTVRACTNVDTGDGTCVEYNQPVTVTLTPANTTTNFWVNGATVTFTGHTSLSFRSPDPTKTLGADIATSSVKVKPLSTPICSTAGCVVNFHDSGFIFDVPNMTANKPVSNVTIQAVQLDKTTQSCAPAFANVSRTLRFYASYQTPATGSKAVSVNDTAVRTVGSGDGVPGDSQKTSLTLTFDANAKAALKVHYADAGLMTLNASYSGSSANGDAYLSMRGSDDFVSKPYGLCVQTAATCTTADLSCEPYPDVRAGDPFDLTVKAVAWAGSDTQSLTADQLCENMITPNFALSGIDLASTVVAPAKGIDGNLKTSSYDHALGNVTSVVESLSDVGVFRIKATPKSSSYLGSETVSGGTSALIGRMIPAYLDVSGSGTLAASCNSFSYQGQPMAFGTDPTLAVTGKNRQGQTTQNYDRGNFWRLGVPSTASDPYSSVTGKSSLDKKGRLVLKGSTPVEWTAVSDGMPGDGQRLYRRSGDQLIYVQTASASVDDLPFDAKATFATSVANLTDQDGACYMLSGSADTCQAYALPISGPPVHLGRLSIGNANGSELQALDVPWQVESWQESGGGRMFAVNPVDTCTLPALGSPALGAAQGNLSASETNASLVSTTLQKGFVHLTAPGRGNDGSIQASFSTVTNTLPWLRFDWRGAGLEAPVGLATFGIYQGSPPLIFRREVYR